MRKIRLLLVASNGGHLVQLQRLKKSYEKYDNILVSSSKTEPDNIPHYKYYFIQDSNKNQPIKLFITAYESFKIYFKNKPDIVISTGAAPGLFFILWSRIFKSHAIWIDSIANTNKMSLAGKLANKLTVNCYTQWEEVSKKEHVKWIGRVI